LLWTALFGSPLAIGLWMVAIIGFALPILYGKRVQRRMHMTHEEEGEDTTD
jgi:putative tricarboxylic transport membrane protein